MEIRWRTLILKLVEIHIVELYQARRNERSCGRRESHARITDEREAIEKKQSTIPVARLLLLIEKWPDVRVATASNLHELHLRNF